MHPLRRVLASFTRFKVFAINLLAQLVVRYPTALKSLHAQLSPLCLRHLSGAATVQTEDALLRATSGLYVALPLMGGKVGAATAWRKQVDETVAFAREAYASLRTTFPVQGESRILRFRDALLIG
jgi:hypothetical protein